MELSSGVVKSLLDVFVTKNIEDDEFEKILKAIVTNLTDSQSEILDEELSNIVNSKREEFNKVYSNVAMLYTESARHNYDEEMLSNYLKSLEAQGARVDLACKTYSKYKGWLERRLSQIGNQLPHITDVHWRLDYCTKSNTPNFAGTPTYHVQFFTRQYGKEKKVNFTCTTQQLQDIVYKLKDAVRHIEKIASNA